MRRNCTSWQSVMLMVLAALVLPVLIGCGAAVEQTEVVRPVRAMKIGDFAAMTGRSFPGRASATQEVDLAFRVSGPLVARDVLVGDDLEVDDVIAQIDPRDFRVALESAESNLQRAEANLAAMKIGARPEELQQMKANVDRAQASFVRADQDLARAKRLVPSGTMTQAEYDRVLNVHAKAAADPPKLGCMDS